MRRVDDDNETNGSNSPTLSLSAMNEGVKHYSRINNQMNQDDKIHTF